MIAVHLTSDPVSAGVTQEALGWWADRVLYHLGEMHRAIRHGNDAWAETSAESARGAAILAGTCYRLLPLRVACAWCQTEMRAGREPSSHGICGVCAERELAREEQS